MCITINTMKLLATTQRLCALLLVLLATSQNTEASNILAVFPHFGYSHFKVVQPILNALAERGHKVTVISYVKNSQPPPENYEERLLNNDDDQTNKTINVADLSEITTTRSLYVLLGEYFALHNEGQKTCELLYNSKHVNEVIEHHRRQPYDLLFTEYFNSDCQLGIAHLLRVPVVGLSTCTLMPWYYDRINLPDTPAYIQSEFIGFPEQLDWKQRFVNFLQAKVLKTLYRYRTNAYDNALIKRYLNVEVDVDAVAKAQTNLIMVNQHYSLMGSRPHSRQLLEVGGVHIGNYNYSKQELPQTLANFLGDADEGIIFISWGSMVRASSIEKRRLSSMVKVLEQQPYKVIWKWESDELPTQSKKFMFVKWAPQLFILCHPNVKLFWAHGGLLGTTEAVRCGKPLLVTPIYGDQFTNAYAVQNRGIGLKLDYNDINELQLKQSLKEVLSPTISLRARKLGNIFRERERTPLESAVWALEHHSSNGQFAGYLVRTPATELNWFIYYSLDSISLLLALLLLTFCLWILSLKLLFRKMFSTKRKTD